MILWVTGFNAPGEAPHTEPVEHHTFDEAWQWLRAAVTDRFFEVNPGMEAGRALNRPALHRYDRTVDLLQASNENEPLSFFYEGLVFWLADVEVAESA